MNVFIIAAIVVLIIVIYIWSRRSGEPTVIDYLPHFEQNYARREVISRGDAIIARDDKMIEASSDELFTIASAYLHEMDDMQDIISRGNANNAVFSKYDGAYTSAKRAITLALQKRERENRTARDTHIFGDEVLIQRVDEVLHPPIAPPRAPPQVDPPIITIAAENVAKTARPTIQWSADPENVHDSTIGKESNERIDILRRHMPAKIPHTEIAEHIRAAIAKYAKPHDVSKAEHVLAIATANNWCSRYNIGEMDALGLVVSRARMNPDHSDNLNESLVRAIVDSATSDKSTVCMVGRITRYLSSLDAVDPMFTDTQMHTTESYRNEILTRLGDAQARSPDGISREKMDEILAEYREKMPPHAFERIREQCIAAIS